MLPSGLARLGLVSAAAFDWEVASSSFPSSETSSLPRPKCNEEIGGALHVFVRPG